MSNEPIHLPRPIIFYFLKLCKSRNFEKHQSDPIFGFNGFGGSNGFQDKDFYGRNDFEKSFFEKKSGKSPSIIDVYNNPVFGFDQFGRSKGFYDQLFDQGIGAFSMIKKRGKFTNRRLKGFYEELFDQGFFDQLFDEFDEFTILKQRERPNSIIPNYIYNTSPSKHVKHEKLSSDDQGFYDQSLDQGFFDQLFDQEFGEKRGKLSVTSPSEFNGFHEEDSIDQSLRSFSSIMKKNRRHQQKSSKNFIDKLYHLKFGRFLKVKKKDSKQSLLLDQMGFSPIKYSAL